MRREEGGVQRRAGKQACWMHISKPPPLQLVPSLSCREDEITRSTHLTLHSQIQAHPPSHARTPTCSTSRPAKASVGRPSSRGSSTATVAEPSDSSCGLGASSNTLVARGTRASCCWSGVATPAVGPAAPLAPAAADASSGEGAGVPWLWKVKRRWRSEGRLPLRASRKASRAGCSVRGSTSGVPVSASVREPSSGNVGALQGARQGRWEEGGREGERAQWHRRHYAAFS